MTPTHDEVADMVTQAHKQVTPNLAEQLVGKTKEEISEILDRAIGAVAHAVANQVTGKYRTN